MRIASLTCAVISAIFQSVLAAHADDVTLRMKGGSFTVEGTLVSRDQRAWVIISPGLGRLTLDASRYECVAGNCTPSPSQMRAQGGQAVQLTTWSGDTAIGTEVLPKLIEAYAASKGFKFELQVGSDPKNLEFILAGPDKAPVGRVKVERQGEPQAFVGLAKGAVDAVWSTRPILPEEEQIMANAGIKDMHSPYTQFVWALDALVVVVAKESPVVSLTTDDIARIFAGGIKDWSELGLPPGKINVYAPAAEMGTWVHFENSVLRPRGLSIREDAVRLALATEWSDKVASDPNGIGLSTVAFVRKAKPLNIEMPCGIVTAPSVFSAKTEEYPLTRRLYLYTRGQTRSQQSEELLSFALSSRMQPVLKDARFVDQEPTFVPFSAQTNRVAIALNAPPDHFDAPLMSKLIEDIRYSQRLSLTFRFATGPASLDPKAASDISRLATLIASPEMTGKTVLLMGFSDTANQFNANLTVSRKRSQLVRDALMKALRGSGAAKAKIIEAAYGDLAPVACNDVESGRALNRRVEVWVR